ncbi:UNVERIFIED_CONTAM: hypothetical protein FKN15_050045 [Acipenser sinensis]
MEELKTTSFNNGKDNPGFKKEDGIVDSGMNKPPANASPSFVRKIAQPFTRAKGFCQAHSQVIKTIGAVVLLAGYLSFFIAACVLDFHRALALVVITALVAVFTGYELVNKFLGDRIIECFRPGIRLGYFGFVGDMACPRHIEKARTANFLWWGLHVHNYFIPLLHKTLSGYLSFFIAACVLDFHRALALVVITALVAVFTGYELVNKFLGDRIIECFRPVSWRAVFWGLGLQFALGLFIIRTDPGFEAFSWLGKQIQALPIVIFFSCVMSVLYYVGVMQWLIIKIAWLMQVSMRTSPTESLSVAGNIFVGQIDASSLIAASVMAAPCALALSKLSYPETEETKFKNKDEIKIDSGEQQNILEAASNGASDSIGLVANIAANLIAFLAVLEFINAALQWLGGMVDYPELSFQLICSYIFMPVTFMMGISWEDSFLAAELIGTKLFLNEFVAYEKLSAFKRNRFNGLEEYINGQKQWVSMRTETICTFALCGFANFSSVGIMLGGLSSIAPSRKSDIANIVVRALLTGTCVSLVNASVAGILYVPDCVGFLADSHFNSTSPDLLMCCKELFGSTVILGNGTVSFDGIWSGADSKYFSGCCGLYNNTLCTGL